jgi:hypothetical protein
VSPTNPFPYDNESYTQSNYLPIANCGSEDTAELFISFIIIGHPIQKCKTAMAPKPHCKRLRGHIKKCIAAASHAFGKIRKQNGRPCTKQKLQHTELTNFILKQRNNRMNFNEIKVFAQRHGIRIGKMNKTELMHAIQGAEDNDMCFNTGISLMCGEISCQWKEDCDRVGAH